MIVTCRKWTTLAVCSFMFIIGVSMTTDAGMNAKV